MASTRYVYIHKYNCVLILYFSVAEEIPCIKNFRTLLYKSRNILQRYSDTPGSLQAVYYWLICMKKLTEIGINSKERVLKIRSRKEAYKCTVLKL